MADALSATENMVSVISTPREGVLDVCVGRRLVMFETERKFE